MRAHMVPVARLASSSTIRLTSATLSLLLVSLPSAAQQPRTPQEPVIRMDVNLVQVPVRVLAPNGMNLVDLQKQDFRVFENGVEQEVGFLLPANYPVYVALVVDTSGSTIEHLPMLKRAAREFVRHFGKEDHLAVFEIGPQVVRVVPFTLNHRLVREGIDALETSVFGSAADFKGAQVFLDGRGRAGTLLHDGIVLALRSFPPTAQRRAILVFTDAKDHGSQFSFRSLRELTLQGNEMLYAVMPKQEPYLNLPLQQLAAAAGASPGPPQKSMKLVSSNESLPEGSFAMSPWALILDLSGTDDDDIPRFQATARRFLEELHPEASVWLFDYRTRVRVLAVPDEDGKMHPGPLSPLEAQHVLGMSNSIERAPDTTPSRPVDVLAERVLILSDRDDTGLRNLYEEMKWSPDITAVLHPEDLDEATEAEAIQTIVHNPVGNLILSARWIVRVFQRMLQQFGALAKDTGGSAFVIQKPKELQAVYARVAREIRSSYTLGYYTKGIPGQHALKVEIPSRQAVVQSRRWVVIQ